MKQEELDVIVKDHSDTVDRAIKQLNSYRDRIEKLRQALEHYESMSGANGVAGKALRDDSDHD